MDVDEIEQRLVGTAVFTTCGAQIDWIGRLSDHDGRLDGTYCSRAKAATVREKLRANDSQYRDL
jgi:hypothetical protein